MRMAEVEVHRPMTSIPTSVSSGGQPAAALRQGAAAQPRPADTRLCSLSSPLNSTVQYLQSFLITVIDHRHLGDYS